MRRSLSLVLALAVTLVCAGPASAGKASKTALTTTATTTTTASTPPQLFGFNDNAVAFGQLTAAADATLAKSAGATVSRVTFDWRWAEPTQGNWKLSQYDAIYNADLAAGIQPVFILAFAPQWAWADPSYCATVTQPCRYPPGPTHLDAWRAVVTKLVTRYPKLAGLEIWNEPNLDAFWKGGLDPAYYTQLLGEAKTAVSAAGSTVPVLGGALAGYVWSDTPTMMNERNYLKAMYAAGATGKMDGISFHPYAGDIDLGRVFKMITETRDIRDANGDNVPLWIDEIGITTLGTTENSFSENQQALILDRYYKELSAMKDVRAVMFHTLLEPPASGAADPERGYGVVRFDLSYKPAFCSIAKLRGTSFACPAATAAVTDDPAQQLRWNAQHTLQAAADAARTWYAAKKTYVGLNSTQLHALNPALSASAPDAAQAPGAAVDPSKIGVWVWGTAGAENLLLCNNSQADRSYCIETQAGNPWVYGSTTGNINTTAGSVTQGLSTSW